MSETTKDEEDKKPVKKTHINLIVNYNQDGTEVSFMIKRSTLLSKLMSAHCDHQSVAFNSITFLFEGRRIRGHETLEELEMDDGSVIDAMLHQTGGCFA